MSINQAIDLILQQLCGDSDDLKKKKEEETNKTDAN